MTSTTPRIITAALLSLAVVAPAASAMPIRDNEGVQTSSLAGTTSAPRQDLRGAEARPGAVFQGPGAPPILKAVPREDLRNPDNRAPRYQAPADRVAPIPVQQTPYTADQLKPISTPVAATTADDDPSPFVYIIPAVALVAMAATGFAFARTRRSTRKSPA
jgi:hypothetical protein